jgi:AraC-like DNA-binding protein/effector-binding domain-containing protein
VQPVFAFVARNLDGDLSLEALSGRAGLSRFHLHRLFSRTAHETLKQFTLRLRLDRAAAMLLVTQQSALNVALECGFQSHEAFCRAFRRRFAMSPSAYRARGWAGGARREQADKHAALVRAVGACVGFVRWTEDGGLREPMEYSIAKKMLAPQPVLVVRKRIKPDQIANTLGELLGKVFLAAQQNAMALAGHPFMRYLEWGPGLLTIEAGLPVASHGNAKLDGDLRAETLPGGQAAATTHAGDYSDLMKAHAAVQQWIDAQGLKAQGAPWEVYVTDPADYPDPKDWKTEIFWPLA